MIKVLLKTGCRKPESSTERVIEKPVCTFISKVIYELTVAK
jgi:hypothetical protein